MSIAKLSHILRFLGGSEPSESERQELFKEALLMTLARATDSDSNIHPVEVATVVNIVKRETGDAVSAADVRVAAASELYEKAPLDQHLERISRSLKREERSRILACLGEVIQSDVRVSMLEIDFFNWVAAALKVTPADLAGLREGD